MKPRFEDSGWHEGQGGFGSPGTPGAVVGTEWHTSDIWIRRTFHLDATAFALAALRLHHDEDTEVYLNGQQVVALTGYTTAHSTVLTERLSQAMIPGISLLAILCRNTGGGQFLDTGIQVGTELKQAR